jgi:Zn-dependent peptidase ImmA (M78 family)
MKIIITEQQYKLINEQIAAPINLAYNQIIDAVKGFGTNPDKLIVALNNLKSQSDFYSLNKLFLDNKTGYESFDDMINNEMEMDNFDDVKKISDKLSLIGVESMYSSGKNRLGMSSFLGNFETSEEPKPTQIPKNTPRVGPTCKSIWSKNLTPAKKYWIQWLSNPITKQKFKKNWNIKNEREVNDIFKKYVDALNKLTLVFYDKFNVKNPSVSNSYAYVNPKEYNPKIYVNCSMSDKEPLETLVHEIQHILYGIKPLNPEKQVGDVFVTDNTVKMSPKDFLNVENFIKNSENMVNRNIQDASKKYNIRTDVLTELLSRAKKFEREIPGYVCDESEKMSNIMAVRKYLGINPGENITKEMLVPYLSIDKHHTDIFWILYCWALKGFGDINVLLNKINSLAYQNTGKDSETKLA